MPDDDRPMSQVSKAEMLRKFATTRWPELSSWNAGVFTTSIPVSDFVVAFHRHRAWVARATIRWVRGEESQTMDALEQEVYAALQAELGVPMNWNTMMEMFEFKDWAGPGDRHLIVIVTNPLDMLSRSELPEFTLELWLSRVLERISQPQIEGLFTAYSVDPTTPFSVVLHQVDGLDLLHQRLDAAGIPWLMLA